MNAVEIAEAVAELVEKTFDREEFPYAFLQAFDNPETTIQRLRSGNTNRSDVGGVLQRNNIHILVCDVGDVSATLKKLGKSPATKTQKAKFILATDGADIEAEDLNSGETLACALKDLEETFGFFLTLANITTVREIRESSFDIKATGRLNKLYMELLKHNPDWATTDKQHEMNNFMARLIFCFFSEDTGIFGGGDLLTETIEKMSSRDASDVNLILGFIFKTMNTKTAEREKVGLPKWTNVFPYVNGGLFAGSTDAPRFSKIARTYLLHIGKLDWTKINPDVFGSMIQVVADEEERGALGMHYTSVPNILKVLNPLFINDLRQQLEDAENNPRKLLNLRDRIKRIRVFDPACGSGNFLVIAYKELREIEAEINARRNESNLRTEIPLTNFRGIEMRDFSCEIARLALIIAEYQCDTLYIGQKEALDRFLPLDTKNWITCGNGLRLDWLSICPPTGTAVKHIAEDLFMSPLDQAQIDFENEGGETFICGNPPYLGSKKQSIEQKEDLERIAASRVEGWRSLDYVAGWFFKAADFGLHTPTVSAFVVTNSLCQGQQVPILWSNIFKSGYEIAFAYTSFKWSNLASHNAGVTVAIVAISNIKGLKKRLYSVSSSSQDLSRTVSNINAYLVSGLNIFVERSPKPLNRLPEMMRGNMPYDGGNLLMSASEKDDLGLSSKQQEKFVRQILGSAEFIKGVQRYCLWIEDDDLEEAYKIGSISARLEGVKKMRSNSSDKAAQQMAKTPHRMREMNAAKESVIVLPRITSENRDYLPVGVAAAPIILSSQNFAIYDGDIFNIGILASRIHWVWIKTVCTTMRTDFSYTNTLGWNTFPIPTLTEKHRKDLTRCAEDILLARESHFPATIADLYKPEHMPDNLKEAHFRNDETIERIYIGRRFKNDTERLEKLFELYSKMTKTLQVH